MKLKYLSLFGVITMLTISSVMALPVIAPGLTCSTKSKYFSPMHPCAFLPGLNKFRYYVTVKNIGTHKVAVGNNSSLTQTLNPGQTKRIKMYLVETGPNSRIVYIVGRYAFKKEPISVEFIKVEKKPLNRHIRD